MERSKGKVGQEEGGERKYSEGRKEKKRGEKWKRKGEGGKGRE